VEKRTGLEFWFTPRSGNGITCDGNNTSAGMLPPPRYKKAMVVTGIILVMIDTLIPADTASNCRASFLVENICGRGDNGLAYPLG